MEDPTTTCSGATCQPQEMENPTTATSPLVSPDAASDVTAGPHKFEDATTPRIVGYVDISTDPMEEDVRAAIYTNSDLTGDMVPLTHEPPPGLVVTLTNAPRRDAATSPMDVEELEDDFSERRRGCCRHCVLDFTRHELFREAKKIFLLAWPTSLYFLLNYAVNLTPIIFSGHLGTTELAAASLALATLGCTVRAIAMGFTTACDTFFSQTYGSTNRKRVGTEVQKALLCTLTIAVICIVLCLNAETLLLVLGQDPQTSAYVGVFITLYIPAIPAELVSLVLIKYLQCQSILLPIVAIFISVNAINVGCHFFFIYLLGMGFRGAPLALVVAMYCLSFHLLAYIYLRGLYKDTWAGWSMKCLIGWGKFYKLGMAGSCMICFEWWSFEIGVFMAGLLSQIQLGVQGVVLQIVTLAYMIPFGISIILGIRTGSHLGGNKPRAAILTACSGLLVCWFFAALEALFILCLRNYMGYVFTKDETIIEETSGVLLITVILFFFDNTAAACSGIVRGTGRQVLGAVINLFGFYFVGLPISAVLMFTTSLQVKGYWIGLTIGLAAQSVMFLVYVGNFNWLLEAKRALKKAGIHSLTCEGTTSDDQPQDVPRSQSAEAKAEEAGETCAGSVEATNQSRAGVPMVNGERGTTPSSCSTPIPPASSEESMQSVVIKRMFMLVVTAGLLLLGILGRVYVSHECSVNFGSNSTTGCGAATAVAHVT